MDGIRDCERRSADVDGAAEPEKSGFAEKMTWLLLGPLLP
jgi:hypothetical protein